MRGNKVAKSLSAHLQGHGGAFWHQRAEEAVPQVGCGRAAGSVAESLWSSTVAGRPALTRQVHLVDYLMVIEFSNTAPSSW